MNSGAAAADFERRFRADVKAGKRPDALRRYCEDETERFWAWTVPGPDGHVFWTGGQHFTRNDKRTRKPCRWVWESLHGPILTTTDVWPTCGERNCVSPDHLTSGRVAARNRFTEAQVIGSLQVIALRLGRPPNQTEWKLEGGRPEPSVVLRKFGSWDRALERAGLDPAQVVRPKVIGHYVYDPATIADLILTAIRELAAKLGRAPSLPEYQAGFRAWRHEHGYPSEKTIRRTFGAWSVARRKALDDS